MASDTPTSIFDQRRDLLSEMEQEKKKAYSDAQRCQRYPLFCWIGSIFFGGVAFVLGCVANSALVKPYFAIEPWMVTLLTGAAGFLEVLRSTSPWKVKAQQFFKASDLLKGLISELKYEVNTPTPEVIAQFSRRRREIWREFGQEMYRIDSIQLPPIAAPKVSPEGDVPKKN